MKNLKKISLLVLAAISLNSCSSDDDSTPELINEEEVITTLIVTLTPDDGGEVVTLETSDLDGDGSGAPVQEISGNLTADTTYSGTIEFLNEAEEIPEDITEEIKEEDEDHQIFFVANEEFLTTEYEDFDEDGNPLGLKFTLTTAAAATGDFTVILRHEPTKPNTGSEDAGGETEFNTTYSITVE